MRYTQLIPDSLGVQSMSLLYSRPAADECSPYYFTYIQLVPDGDIVHTLQSQHANIHALLKNTTDANASAHPAPSEWSIKQVVAHLSDTERLLSFRALWFARGEQSALPGMEPNPWVAITDANARALSDLLVEFDQVRAASISLFANLDAAAWPRRGIASGDEVTVRSLAWIIAGHELHHNRSLREQYL
jgi:DinB superfamily